MNKKISIKRVLILLFIFIALFYVYLYWAMGNTSNHLFSTPAGKLKQFTRMNAIEINDNINNRWDKKYYTDKTLEPVSSYSLLKNKLEKALGETVLFYGGNSILYSPEGELYANKGTFIMNNGETSNTYDYYLYLNDTPANMPTQIMDYPAGLVVYKKTYKIVDDEINSSSELTSGALLVEEKINWEKIEKTDLNIYIDDLMDRYFINCSKTGEFRAFANMTFTKDGEVVKNNGYKLLNQ